MKAIFSRRRGASHEISGKVCQDYCQAEVTDSYTIGVVSDGHGGDRYFRSDVGSKSAVEATLDCVREFVQTADESLFSGAPLTQCGTVAAEREKNGSGRGDERYALFRQLFSSIICKWHERILEDAKRPATSEEREKLPEQVAAFERTDRDGNRTGIEQTYGCTLMCFARTKSYWFAFHIGDGKCVAFSVDSGRIENSEPVPWDEKCFRNVTTSLCDPEALDKFRYCYGGKDTLPLAVFLGSDGIDDSLPNPADMANFYVNILKLLGRYSETDAKKELDDELPALSRRGSKDDMSVVCCYDDEALKSGVNTLIEWQREKVRNDRKAVDVRLDELKGKLSASLSSSAPVTAAMAQQRKYWQADIEKARKDLDRIAFREAKLSAELHEVQGERDLARMYEEGRGAEKDLEKALQWYRTAADEHDDTVSQRNLGRMFEHGIGTEENPSEAFGWYQKAAGHGDVIAEGRLGSMYFYGLGTERKYDDALKFCRKAAEEGDAEAQRLLGHMYENGLGADRDAAGAVSWYKKAAGQGDVLSQCRLGYMYENGRGADRNTDEAVKWYSLAALQGDVPSQRRLGKLYESGFSIGKNPEEAQKWYEMAAEQGDEWSMLRLAEGLGGNYSGDLTWLRKLADKGSADARKKLADILAAGEGTPQDLPQAVSLYTAAAESGDAEAARKLADLLEHGCGVPQDLSKAAEYYGRAAEKGDAAAELSLARMCLNGQNFAKAAEHFGKAADQGDAEAQRELARLCENGQGVGQDLSKAAEYYRKSAEQGDVLSQCSLGLLFRNGRGVTQDYGEAVNWFTKAAEKGCALAQYCLGSLYEKGLGVSQDDTAAAQWYEKAAEHGNEKAQFRLGEMYELGHGVPKDSGKAFSFYKKSAGSGNSTAAERLVQMFRSENRWPTLPETLAYAKWDAEKSAS